MGQARGCTVPVDCTTSEEGEHTLHTAKNNFSEPSFQVITSTIVVIYSQEQ